MTDKRPTTTVRCYPEDARSLDTVRKALQQITGDDMAIADAVSACVQAWNSNRFDYMMNEAHAKLVESAS